MVASLFRAVQSSSCHLPSLARMKLSARVSGKVTSSLQSYELTEMRYLHAI